MNFCKFFLLSLKWYWLFRAGPVALRVGFWGKIQLQLICEQLVLLFSWRNDQKQEGHLFRRRNSTLISQHEAADESGLIPNNHQVLYLGSRLGVDLISANNVTVCKFRAEVVPSGDTWHQIRDAALASASRRCLPSPAGFVSARQS